MRRVRCRTQSRAPFAYRRTRDRCVARASYRRRSSRTDATRTYVSLQTAFRRARAQTLHHPLKRARVASNAPARAESRALLIYLGGTHSVWCFIWRKCTLEYDVCVPYRTVDESPTVTQEGRVRVPTVNGGTCARARRARSRESRFI